MAHNDSASVREIILSHVTNKPSNLSVLAYYQFISQPYEHQLEIWETVFMWCYGWSYSPKFICWNPNSQYFRMWSTRKRVFKVAIKLERRCEGGLHFSLTALLRRENCDIQRDARDMQAQKQRTREDTVRGQLSACQQETNILTLWSGTSQFQTVKK